MTRPLAEHRIEPQADEKGNERKNHDDSQGLFLMKFADQHNALNAWIQRALRKPCAIAPLLRDC
jgi:hypothetical protein